MRQIIKKWSCFEVLSPDLTWKGPGLEGPFGLLPPPALACSPMLIFAYPTRHHLLCTGFPQFPSGSAFPLGEQREDCVVKWTPPSER